MLGWWLPENVATDGSVFYLLYWSSAVAMLVAQMLFSRVRSPVFVRRTRMREAVWALVPALLLLSLGMVSHRSAAALAAPRAVVALETAPAATSSSLDGSRQ